MQRVRTPWPRRSTAVAHALLVLMTQAVAAAPAVAERFVWQLPVGFPQPFVPADNPMSEVKVALGSRLFFDTRLSVTGNYSCASCHDPARALTDGRAVAVGATGSALVRNAPSLWNAAFNPSLGWDDVGDHSLERQMRRPLFNSHPVELGLRGRERRVEQSLREDPTMATAFARAFPRDAAPVTMRNVIRAIAAFERTLLAGDSRFDRYVFRGEHHLLAAQEKRGMELFFAPVAGCSACHSGLLLSGSWIDTHQPRARAQFARSLPMTRRKRIPSLRNVTRTAPYMHDGRLVDLRAVMAHYEQAAMDPRADKRLRRPPLSFDDQDALLAFLATLESPLPHALER
jgi:cytochrome c peroxidase